MRSHLLLIALLCSAGSGLIARREPATAMEVTQADFALDLLRQSADDARPLIFSPLSIAVALAMTYVGARGNTHQQMNAVLANGIDDETFHNYFEATLCELSSACDEYKLLTANKLFVKRGFALLEDFLRTINLTYSGELEEIDFSQSKLAAKKINEWVERQTESKIHDLVNSEMFNGLTRLVLVNAIYFKGNWKKEFSATDTRKQTFYLSKNSKKEVDMMKIKESFPYFEDDKLQLLGLRYAEGTVAMYIFLPKEKYGLQALEESFSGEKLLQMIDNCWDREVTVDVPKFKLETALRLKDTLKKLGIRDAFVFGLADFSGMSTTEPLYISEAVHKAFVEVNEKGTEAAAATAIVISTRSASRPLRFVADHPFMFAIVKDRTILFIGRYR